MSNKFDFLIATCNIEAGRFRNEYRALEAEKKKALEEMQKNFIPNSPGYKKRNEEIEAEFTAKVSELRRETAGIITDALEDVREAELARVANVNETQMAKIRAVADIPMTKTELVALIEKYNAGGNYWCNRLLMEIAEKNAIDTSDVIEPTFDIKMNVLDQIAYQADRLINYFPDERNEQKDSAEIRHGYLTDFVFSSLNEAFYGGTNSVVDNNALMRFEARLKATDTEIGKAVIIGEYLRNAKGDKRAEALFSIAINTNISDRAAQLSGYGSEIAEFRNGKAVKYSDAKKAIETLKKTKNEEKKQEIIEKNSGNQFFVTFLNKQKKEDKTLDAMIGNVEAEVQSFDGIGSKIEVI